MTMSTAVDHSQVREHVLRATRGASRWHEPRLSPGVTGASSLSFTIARPLEWPTRLRVSWGATVDGRTDVRVTVRHSAGMSAGSRRLVNRLVGALAAALDPDDTEAGRWSTAI